MGGQLVAVDGPFKGSFWALDEKGLVLGRDPGCDVVLFDSVVSRRHCRIFATGQEARLEDLGSRNQALVNGVPARDCLLHPGDKIAIGRHQFLVASGEPGAAWAARGVPEADTLSWEEAQPIHVDIGTARPVSENRPQTVPDLVLVYETARELGALSSLGELVTAFQDRMTRRFKPLAQWFALVHAQGELALCGEAQHAGNGEPGAAPLEHMKQAIENRRSSLIPGVAKREGRKVRIFTLVSPLTVGQTPVGVTALETETPHGAYDESDLQMLALLGQAVAPILCAVGSIEQLRRDNEWLRARAGESLTLLGESRAVKHVRGQIMKAAKSGLNVLITGETGTGKELAARMLHQLSAARTEPFIVVNCAAIPRDLFESEFFGYEKGAFTGAGTANPGLLAQAHGGYLFLDEIGDLSLENQGRILRAVELGTFRRVGGSEEIKVAIRVIAATNKDIPKAIEEGAFREDLYHRLNGFEISIPPLRDRPSDIELLALHFLQLAKSQAKRPVTGFSPEVTAYLQSRSWPGNVRELRNCIFRAVSLAKEETVTLRDFPGLPASTETENGKEVPTSLTEMEKRHITKVLQLCGGSIKEAAVVLKISRSTLYLKIAEYGIK